MKTNPTGHDNPNARESIVCTLQKAHMHPPPIDRFGSPCSNKTNTPSLWFVRHQNHIHTSTVKASPKGYMKGRDERHPNPKPKTQNSLLILISIHRAEKIGRNDSAQVKEKAKDVKKSVLPRVANFSRLYHQSPGFIPTPYTGPERESVCVCFLAYVTLQACACALRREKIALFPPPSSPSFRFSFYKH